MDLNHEYQNRYVRSIIQVINSSMESGGISKHNFENAVYQDEKTGDVGRDFLVDFLRSNFFNYKENKLTTKLPVKITLLPTGAEYQWLLHALRSPIAALFLDEPERKLLLERLEQNGTQDIMQSVRYYGFAEPEMPDVTVFRTILGAIRERRYLHMTNHAQNGNVYPDQTVIPMRLEYNAVSGIWFLSFCQPDRSRPIKALLSALTDVCAGAQIEGEIPDLQKMMQAKKAPLLVLHIYNEKNTPERALQFFSQYDTTVLRDEDGSLRMEIRHYIFDRDILLQQIIAFGPSVQVLAPDEMAERVREYLRNLRY